jgi:hypothetical protein
MNLKNGGATRPRMRRSSSGRSQPWWLQNLKQHPLKSATAFAATFGGLMLMMFFGHLQELPDIDIPSSASTLWALAVMGGLFTVFVVALPLLPGLHARSVSETDNWRLNVAHQVALSMPAMSLVAAMLFGILVHIRSWPPLCAPALFAGMALIAVDARRYGLARSAMTARTTVPSWIALAADMLMGMLIWGVTLGLGFVLVLALYFPPETGEWVSVVLVGGQLAFLYGAALFGASIDWRKDRLVMGVLLASTLLLPALIGQNLTGFGVAAVRALGLGERPARLVVTAAGCNVLNKASGQTVCRMPADREGAVVCPAVLRSRIGSPYFVELSPVGQDGRWPEQAMHPLIPIAKADVLSWPRIDLSGQKGEGVVVAPSGGTASTPYMTYLDEAGMSEDLRGWLRRVCRDNAAP